jgi:hypothetical protein
VILLISASWVTRIAGMSHWCLVLLQILVVLSRQVFYCFSHTSWSWVFIVILLSAAPYPF